jgi:hypothetical protein
MGSLIHELDNDALLILYVADELPPEDRADVEQQLGVDAVLRAELALIQADAEAATAALEGADRLDPPAGTSASSEAVALRRVSRAFRQWQVEKLVRSRPAPVPERQPRFPKWAYPAATAAAVLLVTAGIFGWERHTAGQAQATGGDGIGWDHRRDMPLAFNTSRPTMFIGDAFGFGPASTPDLADAEHEANSLRRDAERSDVPVMFGGDGAAD